MHTIGDCYLEYSILAGVCWRWGVAGCGSHSFSAAAPCFGFEFFWCPPLFPLADYTGYMVISLTDHFRAVAATFMLPACRWWAGDDYWYWFSTSGKGQIKNTSFPGVCCKALEHLHMQFFLGCHRTLGIDRAFLAS